jgi:hypothetical protein
MKYIINENQYNLLLEQSDSRMPFQPEQFGYKQGDPSSIKDANKGAKTIPKLSELSIDDTVDVISGIIDGVPGIGNVASLGIDLIHSLSYFVRLYYATDENSKIEFGTMGILTAINSFTPLGGNVGNLVVRQGIKQVLKKTPQEIKLVGKKLGLYKETVFLLSKNPWKYNLSLVLVKILGSEIIEFIPKIIIKLKEILSKVKSYKSSSPIINPLEHIINLLGEMNGDIPLVIRLFKEWRSTSME